MKQRQLSDLTIVSICGAADLGKSYISEKIVTELENQGVSAAHLGLDAYLLNRESRLELGLSGYDSSAYELEQARQDLDALKKGKYIYVEPYDHVLGVQCKEAVKIGPRDVLVFEGLHTMHPSFLPLIDITFFVYTSDRMLKTIREEADLEKRNYTLDFSKKIAATEFDQYTRNITPYKEKAKHHLFLESKWKYILRKEMP